VIGRSVPATAIPASRPIADATEAAARAHHGHDGAPRGRPKSAVRARTVAEPAATIAIAHDHHQWSSIRWAISTAIREMPTAWMPTMRSEAYSGYGGCARTVTSRNLGAIAPASPSVAHAAASQ
jgi:hypothetical protein